MPDGFAHRGARPKAESGWYRPANLGGHRRVPCSGAVTMSRRGPDRPARLEIWPIARSFPMDVRPGQDLIDRQSRGYRPRPFSGFANVAVRALAGSGNVAVCHGRFRGLYATDPRRQLPPIALGRNSSLGSITGQDDSKREKGVHANDGFWVEKSPPLIEECNQRGVLRAVPSKKLSPARPPRSGPRRRGAVDRRNRVGGQEAVTFRRIAVHDRRGFECLHLLGIAGEPILVR